MKITIRVIGLIGALLFGTAFWFTYSVPGGVENVAGTFIKERIEKETREKIDSIASSATGTKLEQLAQRLHKGNEDEIAQLKVNLQARAYEKTATVIAEMRDLSCECRVKYAQFLKQNMEFRLATLQSADEKLLDFMKAKYMQVVSKLTQDLRIFTGSNFAIFAIFLLVSFLKPQAVAQLFLPGVLLAASTVICSYCYLFEQNWLFTIIYNDYLGFWYLAYVGAVFALLCDIVFNRARVTTTAINTTLNIAGSATVLSPC